MITQKITTMLAVAKLPRAGQLSALKLFTLLRTKKLTD